MNEMSNAKQEHMGENGMLRKAALVPVILWLACFGSAMSQSVITTTSLPANGVYLVSSTSEEGAPLLDPLRDKHLDGLLPYCPLLVNKSSKQIIAYSVIWSSTDLNGTSHVAEVARYDFSRFPSSNNVAAGSSRVVSHIIGMGYRGLSYETAKRESMDLLSYFEKQSRMVISLDAVVFDDGLAVGDDSKHWIPRWKAHIDAERDVYSMAAASTPTSVSAILLSSFTKAAELARPSFKDENVGISHLQIRAEHADTYDDAYIYMRGVFSKLLLDEIGHEGESRTIASVGAFFNAKRYPIIHKEKGLQ
jgi:hypothetical protein